MSAEEYQQLMNGNKKKPKVVRYNSPSGKITENEVQNQILGWLCLNQIFNWRQNTMGVYLGEGKFRKAPTTGVADILGILPDGKFLAIECKRPGGKPTPDQLEFIENINANNGIAFVADNLELVMEKLEKYTNS